MTGTKADVWQALVREIRAFDEDVRDLPVLEPVEPARVRAELDRFTFDRPIPLDELIGDVAGLLRRWIVHVTHPRYFGLFNPSVREAGVVADALAASFNPQLAAWSHAPVVQEIERRVLRHFAALLGWEAEDAIANFTSGGAEANQSAIHAALAHAYPAWATAGLAGLGVRPTLYATGESHHSLVKAARMAGLGTDALRDVALDARLVLDPGALRRRVDEDRAAGLDPFLVVGTAGTTAAGLVDPLADIAAVAGEAGLWFHVDAAWGGAAVLSDRLRPALAGIERADSVTWDAHKWLSVPMGAGMFFCRHPAAVERAFATSTSYMPGRPGADAHDPYAVTAQWSRRAIGLKVFMALAELGTAGYARLIEHQAAMGDLLRDRLADVGWILANDTPLPLVCFTHEDIRQGRLATGDLLRWIYRRGDVWISDVLLGGRERVLRACITSFRTDEGDIERLVAEVERGRRDLADAVTRPSAAPSGARTGPAPSGA